MVEVLGVCHLTTRSRVPGRLPLRRRPMKRRLLIIAIFLLLGAVVNVAVAWGAYVPCSILPSEVDMPTEGCQAECYLKCRDLS